MNTTQIQIQNVNTVPNNILIHQKIGSGKYKVFLCQSMEDGKDYAMKVYPSDPHNTKKFAHEKYFLEQLSHHHIVTFPHQLHKPLSQAQPAQNFNLLFTEYAPNGTLLDLLQWNLPLSDKIIRTYFRQLIEGLEYLHTQGFAHLDIKLDNLLLDKDFVLKIADFDLSQELNDRELKGRGSAFYRPLEVLKGSCEKLAAVDIYSAGIVLFAMKTRAFPFSEKMDADGERYLRDYETFTHWNDFFWQIKVEELEEKGHFVDIDDDFKELVNGMLKERVDERMTIKKLKASKWYRGDVYTYEELNVEMQKLQQEALLHKINNDNNQVVYSE